MINRVADRPTRIDEVWVNDIISFPTQKGRLYLASVLDLVSRRLIGGAMGFGLFMALRHRRPPAGVVHHSDRGCQYASSAYRSAPAANGCIASMRPPRKLLRSRRVGPPWTPARTRSKTNESIDEA